MGNNKLLASKITEIERKVLEKNGQFLYNPNNIERDIKKAINQSQITFSNFSIKVDFDNLDDAQKNFLWNMSNNELYLYMRVYIDAYTKYNDFMASSELYAMSANGLSRATNTRNNDVWAGVPLIGHGYIRIRYEVSYNNNKFTSAEYLDSWFTGGVTVGSYDARYGYIELTDRNTVAEIYATGTLTYGIEINGLPTSISTDATFLYFDKSPY
ncbi:MAG: hypothetical protein ACK5LT_09070 [Lachnospirales bacterium]